MPAKKRGAKKERRYWKGRTPYDLALDMFERRFLDAMFRECGGNKMEAARRLGLSYATLKYRVARLKAAEEQGMAPGKGAPEVVARVRDQVLAGDSGYNPVLQRAIVERVADLVRVVTDEARRQVAADVRRVVAGETTTRS